MVEGRINYLFSLVIIKILRNRILKIYSKFNHLISLFKHFFNFTDRVGHSEYNCLVIRQ